MLSSWEERERKRQLDAIAKGISAVNEIDVDVARYVNDVCDGFTG